MADAKAAYHARSRVYHPDRYASAELPNEVREYLARYRKLGFPVLWRMQEGVRDGFARAVGTPTLYVVDRKGEIVFKRFGQLREEHYAWIADQLGRPN